MDNLKASEAKIINGQKRKRAAMKYLFIISIIGFQLVNFVIFYVVQNFNSIIMAFQLKKSGGVIWTFENFSRIYNAFFGSGEKSELMISLTNTFRFFLLGLIMFPVSFVTSYFMYKKVAGHNFFRLVFFLPSILSAVVWTTLYKEIVGPEGPIVKLLMFLRNTDEPMLLLADPKHAIWTVMAYSVWMGIAGNFILYGGALSRIPPEVIEAGQLDGIGWFKEMTHVIVPLIFPTIGMLFLLQLTGIFTASGQILLLTNGAFETNTILFFIFQNVYNVPETSNQYNYASAVGIVFTLLTIPVVFLVRSLLNRIEDVQY
ncbi:MAG: sugar ABC transporter permease [Clostridia bacterium]|nr:sugar ABC transporter permease [Clostridia bacterium]